MIVFALLLVPLFVDVETVTDDDDVDDPFDCGLVDPFKDGDVDPFTVLLLLLLLLIEVELFKLDDSNGITNSGGRQSN